MSITPSGFGVPSGPEDTPDYVTSTTSASGATGVAEEIDKLGGDVEGIEERVVTDETSTAAIVGATTLGTANNPVTNPTAARPTGLPVVYWYCSTQPTHWLAGDVWDNTTGVAATTVVQAIIETGGSYAARPAAAPNGTVIYIGPDNPTASGALSDDLWVNPSA
jgi:hypothetical protein